jgi:mannose-6-phosphate isomerase-like protein (cupin superfamily)
MDNVEARRPQRFSVSHLNEADFKGAGLRPYSVYRDLGIAAATSGLATAHVIRMVAPFADEFGKRHHHEVQFQLVYVLKGWFKNEFEGEGVHVMKEGSCWIQPPGIRHTVLGWSDDCELLEIILPAEHATVNDP